MTIKNSSNAGVKKFVYAIMLDEVLETYGAVKDAPPLINIKVATKLDVASLYANNQVVETAIVVGDITVDYETQDMPLEVQADFLGHILDPVTGVLTYNVGDNAPYLAIGYQRTKGNKSNRYVWLYKVKFQEIDEDVATIADKATFQTPKVTGLAIANKNGDWKKAADDDTKGIPVIDFLASVPGTSVDNIAPTVTSVPADAAIAVVGTVSVVATFSKAIAPVTINAANVLLMKADGTPAPANLSMDATNCILTIDPVATMVTGAYIAILTTNIRSLSGVPLAAANVINFTVA